jgi:hypothetical protein
MVVVPMGIDVAVAKGKHGSLVRVSLGIHRIVGVVQNPILPTRLEKKIPLAVSNR